MKSAARPRTTLAFLHIKTYSRFKCMVCHLSGFTEYMHFPAARPRTSLVFLHLRTVDQNVSLEAKLLDLTSIPYVKLELEFVIHGFDP